MTNLVQGPGTLYAAEFGTAEPADTAVASPPGVGWTDVGGTTDGANMSLNQEWAELVVDQLVDRVGSRLTKRDMTISTNLAEPTLENLKIVGNGGTITTGAGFKKYEPGTETSATQPTYKALMFDGWAPGGFVRRVIVRKALNTSNVEFSYKKDGQTVLTAQLVAHYVSASEKPYVIVDGA